MKTKAMMALVAVGLAGSAIAMGDRGHPSGDRVVGHLDEDGDQLVSFEEFQPPGRRGGGRFEAADADGDGNITREEMEAKLGEHLERDTERANDRFEMTDLNNDGTVTREEVKTVLFETIDANEDGYLSADEFDAARESRQERRGQRRQTQ